MRRWLGRIRWLLLFWLVAGLIAWGAYLAPQNLRASVESYIPLDLEIEPVRALVNSPNKTAPGTTKPQSGRVVLIMVSGLGRDDLSGLPALKNLKDSRSDGDVTAGAYLFTPVVPSPTPALVTLLSGASIDMVGGFTLDPPGISTTAPTPAFQLSRLDNLFTAAKRSRNTTAIFGTENWINTLDPAWVDYAAPFPEIQPANDVADAALNFLKKKSANFTLIQLSAMGKAQTDYGYNSPEVLDARISLNTALSRLTSDSQIDLNHTTVIITGDWDNSVRAGDRWTVPLVMLGQAVQPGEKSWGRQEDVAPTIAALLGIEIPRQNQGRILTNALSLPAIDMAEKLLALVEQRQALSRAYRARLGLALPIAINDPLAVDAEKSISVAVQNYRLGLYDSIDRVLDPVLRYTRQDINDAREEWYAQGRTPRAVLVIVLLVLPLAILLISRSALAWLALFGAAIASGLTYLFYWSQGRQFSFNTVTLDGLRESSIWRAALALLAVLLIMALLFDWIERRPGGYRQRMYGRIDLHFSVIAGLRKPPFPFGRLFVLCCYLLAWLIYFSVLIWVGWFYWRFCYFSLLVPQQPPVSLDFGATFMQFLALDNLFGFALAMLAAPILLVIFLGLKRRLLGDGEDEEEDILSAVRSTSTAITHQP